MKKCILVFMVLIIFSSCLLNSPPPQDIARDLIVSQHLFVVNGVAYTTYQCKLPITIYNPNNYPITITANATDYIIAPLGTLELQDFDK